MLPLRLVHGKRAKVTFDDVLEAEFWTARATCTILQLEIEHLHWDARVLHPWHVSFPAQPTLLKLRPQVQTFCGVQHFSVRNVILPLHAENGTQVPHVKGIAPFLLVSVRGPAFSAIQ